MDQSGQLPVLKMVQLPIMGRVAQGFLFTMTIERFSCARHGRRGEPVRLYRKCRFTQIPASTVIGYLKRDGMIHPSCVAYKGGEISFATL